MRDTMVLRPADLEDPFTGLASSGAVPPCVVQTSWKALERIQLIAAKLPPYQSGSAPADGQLASNTSAR
jgi:hypothetical protein